MGNLGDAERYGRTLLSASSAMRRGNPAFVRRVEVLHETLARLGSSERRRELRVLALDNLDRWRQEASSSSAARSHVLCESEVVRVMPVDWGDTTLNLTMEFGRTFAVLNMANAYVAGGGYVEGCPAQEENMFRRTDCHFFVDEKEFDQRADRYYRECTDLLNGVPGRVFLDVQEPRVCFRAGEDSRRPDLGYELLLPELVFPFFELRSAAVDLRGGKRFSRSECYKRVKAQLDTLIENKVRHVVLSAFGCGAFLNPAHEVALCYREALEGCRQHFDCVAFAIFYPGYGPDNFTPFQQVLLAQPPTLNAPALRVESYGDAPTWSNHIGG